MAAPGLDLRSALFGGAASIACALLLTTLGLSDHTAMLAALATLLVASAASTFALASASAPEVHFKPSPLHAYVLGRCPRLLKPYVPTLWASNAHVQIVLRVLWPKPRFAYRRELLRRPDGGTVALDWPAAAEAPALAPDAPVVVVCHTLTGSSDELRCFCRRVVQRGARPVVFIKRGHGGLPLTSGTLQPFGDPSDFAAALAVVRERFPEAPRVGVGFSAGCALLVSYLSVAKDASLLEAGVCVSPGFDAKRLFSGGVRPLYNWLMTHSLKAFLRPHADALEGSAADVPAALAAGCIADFDRAVYVPLAGHKDPDEYWLHNCPMRAIEDLAVPVLCLNAADDPVCTHEMIPKPLFSRLPHAMLALTSHGSHCAYFEGALRLDNWAYHTAMDYLEAVLDYNRTS